jgi:hypothetical protein
MPRRALTPKIDKSKVYLATANGDNEIYLPRCKERKMTRVMMVNSPLLVKLIMQIVFIIPLVHCKGSKQRL